MGGCFPCFESSNKEEEEEGEVEGINGVKGGDEGNKKEFGKEGSAAVNRVSSGIVTFFFF